MAQPESNTRWGAARRRWLALVLQLLPLFGLGGCTAIWTVVPINTFLRQSSAPAFWSFAALVGLCAAAAGCWGFGYFYLARRERLGCTSALLGPLLVIWSFGYLFEGFGVVDSDTAEAGRRQAIILTGLLCTIPVLAMGWDAWRLSRTDQWSGDDGARRPGQ